MIAIGFGKKSRKMTHFSHKKCPFCGGIAKMGRLRQNSEGFGMSIRFSFRATFPIDHTVCDDVRSSVNQSKTHRTRIYLSRMIECLLSPLRLTVFAASKTDAYLINCTKNPVCTKKPRQPTKSYAL